MKKQFWKSKAMWGAIVVFIGGGLTALGYPQYTDVILAIGTGLGIIGIRAAQK